MRDCIRSWVFATIVTLVIWLVVLLLTGFLLGGIILAVFVYPVGLWLWKRAYPEDAKKERAKLDAKARKRGFKNSEAQNLDAMAKRRRVMKWLIIGLGGFILLLILIALLFGH